MSKYYEDVLLESMRLHSADDRPKKRRLTESDGAKSRFKEIQVGPDAAIIDRINADKNVRKLGLNNDQQFIKSVHKEVQRLQKDHPSISFDDAVEMAIDSAVGEIGIGGGPGILDNWPPKGKPLSELTPEERAQWEKEKEEFRKKYGDYEYEYDRVDLGGAPLAEARNPENDEVNAAIRKWANSDRNRLSKKDQETLGKYGISLEDEDSALKQHVPKEVKKYYSGKRMVGSNPQIRTGLTKNAVKSKHDDFDSANYLNKERKTDSETHRKNIFKNAENHAKKKNESLSLKESMPPNELYKQILSTVSSDIKKIFDSVSDEYSKEEYEDVYNAVYKALYNEFRGYEDFNLSESLGTKRKIKSLTESANSDQYVSQFSVDILTNKTHPIAEADVEDALIGAGFEVLGISNDWGWEFDEYF